jgi:sporulation protein YlmC with PRC-barrel domain
MFGSKETIISSKQADLANTKNLVSYINRKVYSKTGNLLGRVKDIILRHDTLIGFEVIGRKKLFIDKEFFESESDNSLMLSIEPITSLFGKHVFDADGKNIGKVKDIERKSNANTFTHLVVRKHFYTKPIKVPKEDIDVSKENIILNKKY